MFTAFGTTRTALSGLFIALAVAGGRAAAQQPLPRTHDAEELSQSGRVDVPARYAQAISTALAAAGEHAPELSKAINDASAAQRDAVCFLIANMPEVDLRALEASYILENVAWAYTARETLPWGRDIPEELFLNDVLPYASVNERRDNWRRDFYERFLPVVRGCGSPGEAAQKLNREMYAMIAVQYHATKRPKPDQSSYESIHAGYASCTGLSILLVDACRAVCVPARLAGTPRWTTKPGNHTWVEVWDQQWYFTGAAEPDPAGLNRAWFAGDAAQANPSDASHRIYATSFQKTGVSFPMVWNVNLKYVSAHDVTAFYTDRCKVRIRVVDQPEGSAVAARIRVRRGGELIAQVDTHRSGLAARKMTELDLPGGQVFEVELEPIGAKPVRASFQTTCEREQDVIIELTTCQPARG